MDIPENWIHSPGIFPYPGNGDNKCACKQGFEKDRAALRQGVTKTEAKE